MVERIRNVMKRGAKTTGRPGNAEGTPTKKRRKTDNELLRRYPIARELQGSVEDAESLEEHKKALAKELGKKKPRDGMLLTLMKATYSDRRIYILNVAGSVMDLLDKYPALSRPAVVRSFC